MADFSFIKIPNSDTWIINAPKRNGRPHLKKKGCVFCPGNEEETDVTVYEIKDTKDKWLVRVKKNKYPFSPIHDVVILTPEHIKSLTQMPVSQFKLSLETFVNRYNEYKKKGSVCIFGNSGHDAGESIGHPHAQIAVIPPDKEVNSPQLEKDIKYWGEYMSIGEFQILTPPYSQWPDEIWIVPIERNSTFGEISYKEIESLAFVWKRLLEIFEIRHNKKFPHNFYIHPYKDWYMRIIPRDKILGGFEMETGIYVNTLDPRETMKFIKENFVESEEKKIKRQRAKYRKGV
ncbi:MAG: hypothetical protein KA035_02065 [Candidatus Levybacteria bacterium]|nr:hypothetical protein [Candidatus Levybacteria bacterium]